MCTWKMFVEKSAQDLLTERETERYKCQELARVLSDENIFVDTMFYLHTIKINLEDGMFAFYSHLLNNNLLHIQEKSDSKKENTDKDLENIEYGFTLLIECRR